jgi:copper(I)-binding protein
MKRILAVLGSALLALALPMAAAAQGASAKVEVTAPWARATAGKVGGVFMTLSTAAPAGDRLTGATSPAAGKVELHTTVKDGDIMRMRPVTVIEVKPGAPVELKPGGLHVMLIDLKAPLKQGDKVPLTLTFERAGPVQVNVDVRAAGATGAPAHNHGPHSHAPAAAGSDAEQIVAVLKKTWDSAAAPLAVEPVVLRGDTAVAGWIQGETGGRALMRRRDGQWRVVLCSGDALTTGAFLRQAGLGATDADALAKAVVAAEGKLLPARRALLSRFEGTVTMDEEGNHPPGHAPGGAGHHGHKH